MSDKPFEANRFFLKDTIRQQIDFSRTEQSRNLPAPPLQKPCAPDVTRVDLPDGQAALERLGRMPVGEAIVGRSSVRQYAAAALTLEELNGEPYPARIFSPADFPGLFALDRKSTRLNSSHIPLSRMPSSA